MPAAAVHLQAFAVAGELDCPVPVRAVERYAGVGEHLKRLQRGLSMAENDDEYRRCNA